MSTDEQDQQIDQPLGAGDLPPPAPAEQAAVMPSTQPAIYQQPTGIPQQQVIAKNPGIAALISAFWTGGGQIYNGQLGLGFGLMALQAVNIVLTFVLIGFLTGFATWIFSIVYAFTYARDFNTSHGIIS